MITLSLFSAIELGVVHNITYSKWMPLLGNNATFGIHKLSIQVNVKERIRGCTLAILTTVPFIIVIDVMIAPVFQRLVMTAMLGRSDAGGEFVLQYYPQIMASYFLYFVAILIFASYLYVMLRNLFLNNLTLTNGAVHFHSSVTAIGIFLHILAVSAGSSITCDLAYPWLKTWIVSWITSNTHVQGNLGLLGLTNDDEPQDSDSLVWISRGIIPYVPFI